MSAKRWTGLLLYASPLAEPRTKTVSGSGYGDGGTLSKEFNGVVNVDIRDSTPDWEPFLQPQAPEGAPNVLMIVWDDVGYGAMDMFGGPIETPNMRRISDAGIR